MVAQRRARGVQVNGFKASVVAASVGGTKAVPFGQFHVRCELVCTTANSLDRRNASWVVRRRYREFQELDARLRRKMGWRLAELSLPGKGVPSKVDDGFLEGRRAQLDAYLAQMQRIEGVASFSRGHLANEELAAFLDFDRRGHAAADADGRSRAGFCALVGSLLVLQGALAGYTVLLRHAQPLRPADSLDTALVLCAAQCVANLPLAMGMAWWSDGVIGLRAAHAPLFALLGFAGVFCGALLYMLGLFLSSPVVASLAMCNTPVWVASAAHAVGIEAATDAHGGMVGPSAQSASGRCASASRFAGCALTLLGSAVALAWVPDAQFGGTVLLLGGCLCTVAARLLHRRFFSWMAGDGSQASDELARYPALTVAAWSQAFGAAAACLSLTYFALAPDAWAADPRAFDLSHAEVQALLFGMVVASSLSSAVAMWVRSRVSEYVLSSFLPVQVVLTVVMSYTLFGTEMTPHEGAAGALIILGLLMVCLATHQQETQTVATYGPLPAPQANLGGGIGDSDLFDEETNL